MNTWWKYEPIYTNLLSTEPITLSCAGGSGLGAKLKKLTENENGSVKKSFYTPSRILKSGNRTIVFWADGTKTIVKRADDETESDYAAFTAAVAKRLYGSNSALKRIVERTETQKLKKKDENVIDRHDEPVTEEQVKQKEDEPNG